MRATMVGTVLSILTVTTLLAALLLPAWSVTVCAVELTALPSLFNSWSAGQFAAPERASVQVKRTATLLVYQPAALGAVVTAALMVGAVLSILTVTTLLVLLLPARSVIICAVEATASPSLLNTSSAGQLVTPDKLSAQVKWMVTSFLYQPLALG